MRVSDVWGIKLESRKYVHRQASPLKRNNDDKKKGKKEGIRSKRRQIEETTSTTKTDIRKTCRWFSHLCYLSFVIIFRQNHLHFISGMRDVVTFFLFSILLFFLFSHSFFFLRHFLVRAIRISTTVKFFFSSGFFYCTHINKYIYIWIKTGSSQLCISLVTENERNNQGM